MAPTTLERLSYDLQMSQAEVLRLALIVSAFVCVFSAAVMLAGRELFPWAVVLIAVAVAAAIPTGWALRRGRFLSTPPVLRHPFDP